MSYYKLDLLPKAKRDKVVEDIVLGRKTMFRVGKELRIADSTVRRYMELRVSDEERLRIVANAAHAHKIKEAEEAAGTVNDLGDDINADLRFVLRELKALLQDAKGDDDRVLQLGTLKELRQSLMSLADLTGKLSRRIDVSFELHQSPAFLELRTVILKVLDSHPDARADFLAEMQRMKVVENAAPHLPPAKLIDEQAPTNEL
jgi:hypothetical protein